MTWTINGDRRRGGGRLVRRLVEDRRGQAISEYLTLAGVIAVIVIAAMTLFTRPVAMAYAALFRRLVLYMTSTS